MKNIVEVDGNSLTILAIEKELVISKFLLEEQLTLNKKLSFGSVIEFPADELIMSEEAVLLQAPNTVFRKLIHSDQVSLDNSISDSFKSINFRSGYEYFYVSISKDEMSFEEALNTFDECFLHLATQPFIIYETKYETVLVIWLFLGNDLKTFKSFYGDFLKSSNEKGYLELSLLENSEIQIKHKLFPKMSTLNWQEGFSFDNFDDDSVSACTMYVFNVPRDENGNVLFEIPVTRLPYPPNNFYENLLLEFENTHVEEMQKIRYDYTNKQISNYQKTLNLDTFEEAQDKWNYFIDHKCIPSGMELISIDGEILSLSDILKNPSEYNGKMFQDPINGVTDRFNALLDLSNPSEPSLLVESIDLQQTRYYFGLDAATFLLFLTMFKHEYFKKNDSTIYYKQLGRLGTLTDSDLKLIHNHYAINGINIKAFNQYYLFKDYDLDIKGKVIPSVDNFEKYILINNYDLFFDPIKKDAQLKGGKKGESDSGEVLSNFRKGLTNLGLNPDKMIKSYYDDYANEHPKNYLWEKIHGYSQSVTEEDIKEFDAFLGCFELGKLMDKELFMQVMNILLLQLVATIDGAEHSPIVNKSGTFEYMFVFVGEGGIGKSKVFSTMFEAIDAKNYFNGEGNPDFSEKAKNLDFLTYGLTEISECEGITLNVKLLDNTKRIISRSEDNIYDKKIKAMRIYKRYSMFIGTTNEKYFVLESNLRRTGTIPVLKISDERYNIDYAKLLGVFVKKYLSGKKWWLSRDNDEDMKLLERMDYVTMNHHAEGEVMLLAKEVFKRNYYDSVNNQPLTYMGVGQIWLALTKTLSNDTQEKRLAKALRNEKIIQNSDYRFYVSTSLVQNYNEAVKNFEMN